MTGGDALYLQQQNFSLEALAKRDAQDDPFRTAPPPAPTPPATPPAVPEDEPMSDDEMKAAGARLKSFLFTERPAA
jgi:hypothetical protein